MRIQELQCREVICVGSGKRLGFISDVELKIPEGEATAIVVPGPCRVLGVAGRKEEYIIPWHSICKIGPDVVLVDARPEDCRMPRPKPGFVFFEHK